MAHIFDWTSCPQSQQIINKASDYPNMIPFLKSYEECKYAQTNYQEDK